MLDGLWAGNEGEEFFDNLDFWPSGAGNPRRRCADGSWPATGLIIIPPRPHQPEHDRVMVRIVLFEFVVDVRIPRVGIWQRPRQADFHTLSSPPSASVTPRPTGRELAHSVV